MIPDSKKDDIDLHETMEKTRPSQASPRKYQFIYLNMVTFSYWHLAGLYGLYLGLTAAKWTTLGFAFILYVAAEIGVTAGAHRLWSHRAYKAKLPLQIILMLFNSLSFQNTVIQWVRDHRLHHKYSDTDADPHNASRGMFYSHVGWVFVKKHPEVKRCGAQLDISDITNNPVLKFQKKYAIPVIGMVGFVLPTVIPAYYWGESLNCAWHVTMLRFIANLNATFLINSAAHHYGYRPYEKTIRPAQNIAVSMATFGEGFHNYHHAFPWDYRAAELGNNWFNITTLFIDFFAWIGWAYELKTVSKDIVKERARRNGDGSGLWGWETEDTKQCSEDLFQKADGKCLKDIKVIRCKVFCGIIVLYCTVLTDASNVPRLPFLNYSLLNDISVKNPLRQEELQHAVQIGELPHHVFAVTKSWHPHNKTVKLYRAFCAGNIIGPARVLTSTNCFMTNRKRLKVNLSTVRVVGGTVNTWVEKSALNEAQQWRHISKIYTQKYYRFPHYDLAILQLTKPFIFNNYVNQIPYASLNQNFDGVCAAISLKSQTSWATSAVVFSNQVQLITRKQCELMTLRSCRLYYCTSSKTRLVYAEREGGGLICFGTNDPKEQDKGVLVGLTTLINIDFPTLHTNVGLFSKWITDGESRMVAGKFMVSWNFCVLLLNIFL